MKKSRLPGPSCSRSHPSSGCQVATHLLHVKTRQCWERGWGWGSRYSLKQQRFYLPHPRHLCGAGARAHKDGPEAPQVQSEEEPARGDWAPGTPCPPWATAQEPLLRKGLPGSSRAQHSRPGPRTRAPAPSGAQAALGGLRASRWSPRVPSQRPRLSELRQWPGDGPGDGAGQRTPRLWPCRPIWAWLLPMAGLDSVLVQRMGGQRPAKHGLPWPAA